MTFQRSRRDRWFRGVCGGIGHQYGVDSTIVRIIFVILALIIPGPSALIMGTVYLALGFTLPEADTF